MHSINVWNAARDEEDVEEKMPGDTVTGKHRQLNNLDDVFT